MTLRQQLQLKRALRNLRTWAPPIAIGVIVGVGFFTLADRLDPPSETAEPVTLETTHPSPQRHAPRTHVVQPELPQYMEQGYVEQSSAPPEHVQQPAVRAVQPQLPQYLRQTSSSGFGNCAAARAAGRSSIHVGENGYASHLDRDNDGIACEPYYGR